MENQALDIIEALYNMIAEARSIPLGNDKCVISRDDSLNLLDELKAQLPLEISEARRLVSARDEFVTSAKQEADSIRRMAEDKARELVQREAVYQTALQQSEAMMADARTKAEELKKAASDFLDDNLRRTDEAISAALEGVRTARAQFRSATMPTNTGTADVSLKDVESQESL